MRLEESPLYADVQAVLGSNDPVPLFEWKVDFLIAGKYTPALKVLAIDVLENYHDNFHAVVHVQVVVGAGFYSKQIYPNRESVELLLHRVPFTGSATDPSKNVIVTEQYTALLASEGTPALEGNQAAHLDEHALDLADVFEVQFQCISKTIQQLRLLAQGGVYRQSTPENLLRTVLTEALTGVKEQDTYVPVGIDMVPATNIIEREQYVIPHGTMLVDIPGLLQEKLGGVYNSGLGHFIKGPYWFIYPLYDTQRLQAAQRTLHVTNVPENLLPGLDRTWRQYGGMTMIICTGQRQVKESAQKAQQEQGTGTRFMQAGNWLDKQADTSQENKAVIKRALTTSEFVAQNLSASQQTHAPVSSAQITDNSARELSALARRAGSFYTCVWEYSEPDVVVPGMMGTVQYLEGETVRAFEGVLVSAYHSTQLIDKGATAFRYANQTALTFFVKRDLDLGDTPSA